MIFQNSLRTFAPYIGVHGTYLGNPGEFKGAWQLIAGPAVALYVHEVGLGKIAGNIACS